LVSATPTMAYLPLMLLIRTSDLVGIMEWWSTGVLGR